MAELILCAVELQSLTGYRQAAAQLAELHRQGYWRARRAPITGRVILERAHYEAVARGIDQQPAGQDRRPETRAAAARAG